jgi:hypothetical protein
MLIASVFADYYNEYSPVEQYLVVNGPYYKEMIPLKDNPSYEARNIGFYTNGLRVKVIPAQYDANWVKVMIGDYSSAVMGYMDRNLLAPDYPKATVINAYFRLLLIQSQNDVGVDLREQPSYYSNTVRTLVNGATVTLLGYTESWFHIKIDELSGFVPFGSLAIPGTDIAYTINGTITYELSSTSINLPSNRLLTVYIGPGDGFAVSGNGKARVSTNGPVWLYGYVRDINTAADWAFIRYDIDNTHDRIGYIYLDGYTSNAKDRQLAFVWDDAIVVRDCVLYDSLVATTVIQKLKSGQSVIYLSRFDSINAYVQVTLENGICLRGRIPFMDIDFTK